MLLVRKKHDQPTQLEWPLFRFISERMSNVASTGVRTINSSEMTDESGYIVIRSHRSLLFGFALRPSHLRCGPHTLCGYWQRRLLPFYCSLHPFLCGWCQLASYLAYTQRFRGEAEPSSSRSAS